MKKLILKITVMATLAFSGNASAQIPVTDVASITQNLTAHVLEYANMAAQYAQQIQEYNTQVQQFDLQKIAAKLADTGQFGDTMGSLDQYKSAFDVDGSIANLGDLKNFSDINSGNGEGVNTLEFLENLGLVTDRKMEISKAQGDLVSERMASIQTDRDNLTALQNANANAEGEMQAAQIGNHINSEMLGQLVKMRQEQASEAQARIEKEALEESLQAAEQAEKLRLQKVEAQGMEDMRNRPVRDAER